LWFPPVCAASSLRHTAHSSIVAERRRRSVRIKASSFAADAFRLLHSSGVRAIISFPLVSRSVAPAPPGVNAATNSQNQPRPNVVTCRSASPHHAKWMPRRSPRRRGPVSTSPQFRISSNKPLSSPWCGMMVSSGARGEPSPGAPAMKKSDHRHRRLLRARRERPRRCRTAEKCNELAARHSITSSATASSWSGTSRPRALAVFRLSTSSNSVGCTTGNSAGLVPLRIVPAYTPARRQAFEMLGP
jgi:hypothetical protein